MECSNCHHWNEPGARFCEECGFELATGPIKASTPPAISISNADPEPAPQVLVAPTDAPAPATAYNGASLVLDSTKSIFRLADFTVIGREDPTLQIDLDGYPDSKYVSHRHAQITKTDGVYYIEDLGSANKTRVNGIKMSQGQSQALSNGDKVRIGKIELIFKGE